MLRRLLILFFIFTNLTAQAGVAYACAMMGGAPVVVKQCCCDPDARTAQCQQAPSGAGCCEQVVDIADGPGDQVGAVHNPSQLPDFKPQPLPAVLPAVFALLVVPVSGEAVWDASHDHGLNGTDTYLRTQRLRL
jgi:hypothetical protein